MKPNPPATEKKEKPLPFKRNKSEPICKDLDQVFKEQLEEKFDQGYKNRAFENVMEKFRENQKQEDFDKKEFLYCRKMLTMKNNENLKDPMSEIPSKRICKIPVNNEVQTEAHFFESKRNVQKEIEVLKAKSQKHPQLKVSENPKKKAAKTVKPSCFALFSRAVIQNKGRLHLFNLADKLQNITAKNDNGTLKGLKKASRSLSKEDSATLKNQKSLSNHQNPPKKPSILKTTKEREELKVANNVNKYMMEALQKDMGLIENTLFTKKGENKRKIKIFARWPNNLVFSTLRK